MHVAAAVTANLVSIHTWTDPRRVGPYNDRRDNMEKMESFFSRRPTLDVPRPIWRKGRKFLPKRRRAGRRILPCARLSKTAAGRELPGPRTYARDDEWALFQK